MPLDTSSLSRWISLVRASFCSSFWDTCVPQVHNTRHTAAPHVTLLHAHNTSASCGALAHPNAIASTTLLLNGTSVRAPAGAKTKDTYLCEQRRLHLGVRGPRQRHHPARRRRHAHRRRHRRRRLRRRHRRLQPSHAAAAAPPRAPSRRRRRRRLARLALAPRAARAVHDGAADGESHRLARRRAHGGRRLQRLGRLAAGPGRRAAVEHQRRVGHDGGQVVARVERHDFGVVDDLGHELGAVELHPAQREWEGGKGAVSGRTPTW